MFLCLGWSPLAVYKSIGLLGFSSVFQLLNSFYGRVRLSSVLQNTSELED